MGNCMNILSSRTAANKPPLPELKDKEIGDTVFLPPTYCSNKHPPNGNLPFKVVVAMEGQGKKKSIGTICEYCLNRQTVPGGLGKQAFMGNGRDKAAMGVKAAVIIVAS